MGPRFRDLETAFDQIESTLPVYEPVSRRPTGTMSLNPCFAFRNHRPSLSLSLPPSLFNTELFIVQPICHTLSTTGRTGIK